MKKPALVLLVAALALPAHGAMLYKSVGANGTIMFSDVPPPADARLVEQRAISSLGSVASAASGMLTSVTELIDADAAVARASAQVDLAEHALAAARRETWSPREGLQLSARRLTISDHERLEFFKRNVLAARQSLMELLRERMIASR
ncbi:MAG TPA: DUF4124 domain-containing protein [Usitatibacter sp.]|nr:DUF4124 domain-containing protein [Usitatibacter sp.]